ncbi:Transglutaminase-like superfamily protein [compost metagenome]
MPTIIDGTQGKDAPKKEESAAPADNLVDAQKDNTKKQVEEGNNQEVPTPDVIKDVKVNADSALEEYLALSMIDAKTEIPLGAFPEAQNFETLSDALQKVVYQNPLILGVKQYKYDYKSLTLGVTYEESADVIKKKQGEIIAEAKKIVASVIKPEMNDDDKRKAIYDYLNDNTKYDDEALKSAKANGFKEVNPKYNDSFNTYGIMVKKVGVCASYASTYKMLSDLSGLKAITVTGLMGGVPHSWNKVKIGNEWVNVDTTNNATNSGIPYLLYNSNDATAKSIEYVPDQGYWLDSELSKFKSTDNSKDYYVVNGLEVKTVSEYGSKLADQLKQGKSVIAIRMGAKLNEDQVFEEAGKVLNQVAKDKLKSATLGTLGTYIVLKP